MYHYFIFRRYWSVNLINYLLYSSLHAFIIYFMHSPPFTRFINVHQQFLTTVKNSSCDTKNSWELYKIIEQEYKEGFFGRKQFTLCNIKIIQLYLKALQRWKIKQAIRFLQQLPDRANEILKILQIFVGEMQQMQIDESRLPKGNYEIVKSLRHIEFDLREITDSTMRKEVRRNICKITLYVYLSP